MLIGGGGGGVEVVDDGAFMLLSFRFGSLLSFELFDSLGMLIASIIIMIAFALICAFLVLALVACVS